MSVKIVLQIKHFLDMIHLFNNKMHYLSKNTKNTKKIQACFSPPVQSSGGILSHLTFKTRAADIFSLQLCSGYKMQIKYYYTILKY